MTAVRGFELKTIYLFIFKIRQFLLINLMAWIRVIQVPLNDKCLCGTMAVAVGKSDQEILDSSPTFVKIFRILSCSIHRIGKGILKKLNSQIIS